MTKRRKRGTLLSFKEWSKEFFDSGIKNSTDYAKGYKKYKNWPASPQCAYRKDMISWPIFLGKENDRHGVRFSLTYEEWKIKVKSLEVATSEEYIEIVKQGRDLPTNPSVVFKDDWIGWSDVFDREYKRNKKWLSYEDLKVLLKENNIKTSNGYHSFFCQNKNKGVPSHPGKIYPEWTDWQDFLRDGEALLISYDDLQKEVRSKGISSYSEYNLERKENGWPCYPPQIYTEKWVSWKDFLGQPRKPKASYWISMEEFQSELRDLGVVSKQHFDSLRRKNKEIQKRWPINPLRYYNVSSIWKLLGFDSKEEMLIARKLKRDSLLLKFERPVKVFYPSIYKPNPFLEAVKHVLAF